MSADDPTAALLELLAEEGIGTSYPEAAHAEVEAWLAEPGIDDPSLEDRTEVPFVTVDGASTRDLDQALFVEARGGGYGVQYAIADASWFAPAGSALFDQALQRGASYYLPGTAVPMLPRALSEDLVSLGEGVNRRAMVFDMTLDAQGVCTKTEIVRARIRSRHKLSFDHVQSLLEGGDAHPVTESAVAESLRAMRSVGHKRTQLADARGVVPYTRTEVRVKLTSGATTGLTAVEVARNQVEADNAQLSLLCNAQGAEVLRAQPGEHGQPIYKVHPPPQDDALEALAERIDALVEAHDLDASVRWDRAAEPLAEYVRRVALGRSSLEPGLAAALMRQTIMVNVRSAYAAQPARHHGVGADVYGRYSAPMREVVGVFLHKEMFEALSQRSEPTADDEALRQEVIAAAERAKQLQSAVSRAADQRVIDDLFAQDMEHGVKSRTVHRGTVMGLRRGRLYVRLDSPPLDVKVYVDRLGPSYACDDAGAALYAHGRRICRLGDSVGLRAHHRDDRGRWELHVVP